MVLQVETVVEDMACSTTLCLWKRYVPVIFILRPKFLLVFTTIFFGCFITFSMIHSKRDKILSTNKLSNTLQEFKGEMKSLEQRNQERYTNISSRITEIMLKVLQRKQIFLNTMETETNKLVMHANQAKMKSKLQSNQYRPLTNKEAPSSSLRIDQTHEEDHRDDKQRKFREHRLFPLCKDSLVNLRSTWNTSTCYTEYHKINGSTCSLYKYLTQVEPYCVGEKEIYATPEPPAAIPRQDIGGLLQLLPGKFYKWMRKRATLSWKSWVSKAKKFSTMKNKPKNVLVFLDGLNFNHFLIDYAEKGGPLGELVQWTDVITSLYVLGYNVTVVRTIQEVGPILKDGLDKGSECAVGRYPGNPDVIYGDINSYIVLKLYYGEKALARLRCTFRILDSFGTFAEFNFAKYPHPIPGGRSKWGNLNLHPTQFMTMYPHTQDNSYLGFVVPDNTQKHTSSPLVKTKQKALLYAKDSRYMYRKNETLRYLEIVSEYFEIHATCGLVHHVPSFIRNHGAVSGQKVQQLLSEAKVFLGVGFPYEGPGPIEAMANGAVYLQPKFLTPINKMNEKFFAGKPTLRKLQSQNPYMEDFVGEPYCYTIDVTDENQLRKTLIKISSMERLSGKIPKDFSYEGMLERMHVYTQRMDYCNPFTPRWPPIQEHLKVHFSAIGESCKEVCMSKGLVCERTFFDDINTVDMIETYSHGVKCSAIKIDILLHAPSVNSETGVCFIQHHQLAFSCMHSEPGFRRLCPCRDYEQGQSALCRNCL